MELVWINGICLDSSVNNVKKVDRRLYDLWRPLWPMLMSPYSTVEVGSLNTYEDICHSWFCDLWRFHWQPSGEKYWRRVRMKTDYLRVLCNMKFKQLLRDWVVGNKFKRLRDGLYRDWWPVSCERWTGEEWVLNFWLSDWELGFGYFNKKVFSTCRFVGFKCLGVDIKVQAVCFK